MSIFNNNILAGAASQSTTTPVHTIDQSIRFNALDNPYMSKAFSSKGSPKKFTLSWWTKLGERTTSATSESQMFFIAYHSGGYQTDFSIQSAARAGGVAHTFRTYSVTTGGGAVWNFTTTQLFRDPSAWYNFVVVSDTDNAVQTERFRLYINGQRVTDFSTATYPSSGVEPVWNNSTSVTHYVGSRAGNTNTRFDGYMAEMVHIDGQALDPSSFGETNSSGIWVPKDVSGLTFGTNGFHIDGRDSADLGDDESGQGNDFTTSGLAAHDQMLDSPSNNFCTINSVYTDNSSQVTFDAGTLSNGNLVYVGSNNTYSVKGFTFDLPKSGKWYFEYMIGGNSDGFGFVKQGEQGTINASNGPGQLSVAQGGGIQYTGWRNNGNFTVNFADTNTGSPFTAGFIHQVAIDVDNGKFFYGVKNTYYAADTGSDGNPSAGTNETSTFAFSTTDVVLLAGNYTGTQYWNFGQDGTFAGQQTAQGNSDANGVGNFYYAPPTGYLALCTKNLGS